MEILSQVELQKQNSMALPCIAKKLIQLSSKDDLQYLSDVLEGDLPVVLGGGSNVILPPILDRTVLQYVDQSVRYTELSDTETLVEAAAGAVWDELVEACVAKQLRGIENLSLIPGSVGAAPVQNIGAYGVELADVLAYVEAYDLHSGSLLKLECDKCGFAYRDSVFKQQPGRYLILSVGLVLSANASFKLNYGELTKLRDQQGVTAEDVRAEVIRIRQSKLPDPKLLPNAGSFFKNPIVADEVRDDLLSKYPGLVHYPAKAGFSKLAAGWLIDQAGWKGHQTAGVGIHEKQALVVVNFGDSTQQDVLSLAESIQADISDKFGVALEIEPVILRAR